MQASQVKCGKSDWWIWMNSSKGYFQLLHFNFDSKDLIFGCQSLFFLDFSLQAATQRNTWYVYCRENEMHLKRAHESYTLNILHVYAHNSTGNIAQTQLSLLILLACNIVRCKRNGHVTVCKQQSLQIYVYISQSETVGKPVRQISWRSEKHTHITTHSHFNIEQVKCGCCNAFVLSWWTVVFLVNGLFTSKSEKWFSTVKYLYSARAYWQG